MGQFRSNHEQRLFQSRAVRPLSSASLSFISRFWKSQADLSRFKPVLKTGVPKPYESHRVLTGVQ